MEKKLLTAIGFIFLMGLTACKKEKDFVPQNNCQVAQLTSTGGVTGILQYDKQGRLIGLQQQDENGNILEYETYKYFPDEFLYTQFNPDNTVQHIMDYYLNTDGTVKYRTLNRLINGFYDCDTVFFYYDAEGYNTLQVKRIDSQIRDNYYDSTFFTYQGGNLIHKKSITDYSGRIVTETDYIYLPLANKQEILIDGPMIPGISGKPNKNLIASSVTRTTNSFGTISQTEKYTYELNPSGYVTKHSVFYDIASNPVRQYTVDVWLKYMCE